MISNEPSDTMTLLNILQISDSVFPTGGFSHSVGFEAADKHEVVKKISRESYERFLYCTLENAASLNVPFVREGHANYSNIEKLNELDKSYQTYLSNHVANRASVKQGRSLIDTSAQTFPDNINIQKINNLIQEGHICGHHAPLYGALCASLGISVDSSVVTFMFTVLKTVVAASVRLGSMGTLKGQKIQHMIQQDIPDIIERTKYFRGCDAHICFPVVDVCQNLHDTMFSKLFFS